MCRPRHGYLKKKYCLINHSASRASTIPPYCPFPFLSPPAWPPRLVLSFSFHAPFRLYPPRPFHPTPTTRPPLQVDERLSDVEKAEVFLSKGTHEQRTWTLSSLVSLLAHAEDPSSALTVLLKALESAGKSGKFTYEDWTLIAQQLTNFLNVNGPHYDQLATPLSPPTVEGYLLPFVLAQQRRSRDKVAITGFAGDDAPYWTKTLFAVLALLGPDRVEQLLLPSILDVAGGVAGAGQNQIEARALTAANIGAICTFLPPGLVRDKLVEPAISLCQDIETEVRGSIVGSFGIRVFFHPCVT